MFVLCGEKKKEREKKQKMAKNVVVLTITIEVRGSEKSLRSSTEHFVRLGCIIVGIH